MIDNVEQLIHILLHLFGGFDGLLGKLLNRGQLFLTCLYFLIHFVCLAGHVDDGMGQLFVLVAGIARRGAEDRLCGVGHLLGYVNDLIGLILHCQIQGADLHDCLDAFVEELRKLFSSVGQSFIDAVQFRIGGVIGRFQLRDSLHQYFFLFSNGHIISFFL